MDLKLYYDGAVEALLYDAANLVEAFIKECDYAIIGTVPQQGGVRLSALNNLPGQKINELWFATGLSCQKTRNLAFNPTCEVMMTNGEGQLMLGGSVEIVTSPEMKEKKWQRWMEQHFLTAANDDYCLLKLTPDYIRVMLM